MVRLATTLLFVGLTVIPADAQGSRFDRAVQLLNAGYAAAALDILETLPETPGALAARAQAHVLLAAESDPAMRCDHLRRAMDFASMSSAGEVLETARKAFTDWGC